MSNSEESLTNDKNEHEANSKVSNDEIINAQLEAEKAVKDSIKDINKKINS